MPHRHSTTEAATRRIEDTIEQLLRRGQQISSTLKREMNYAGKLHRERVPCRRSTSRATELDKNQGSRSQMTVVVSSCSQIRQKRDESLCQKKVPSVFYQTKKGGDRSERSQKKEKISLRTTRLPISSCFSLLQSSFSSKDRKEVKRPKICSRPKKESCSSQSRVKSQKKPVSPSEMSSCSYSTFTTKKQKVFSSGQEKGQSVNPTSSRGESSRLSSSKEARSIVSESLFDHVQVAEKVESRYCFEECSVDEPDSWVVTTSLEERQSRVKVPVEKKKRGSSNSGQKSHSVLLKKPICRLLVKKIPCLPLPPKKIEMTSFPVDPVPNFKSYPDDWTRIYQNKTTHGPDEILTRVYSPNDPNSKWIRVNEIWKSQQGGQVLNLWLDLLGEEYRNVWVNGKQIGM